MLTKIAAGDEVVIVSFTLYRLWDMAHREDYVFVVDEDSGDVSVIHIPAVLHKRGDAIVAEAPKPVFAMFHGGAEPQSAVIVPYSS